MAKRLVREFCCPKTPSCSLSSLFLYKTYQSSFHSLLTVKTMRAINPWINFNGNAEEALTFYKSVFGGEFTKIVRFGELASEAFEVPCLLP